jgi:hypothetical protein
MKAVDQVALICEGGIEAVTSESWPFFIRTGF